MMRKHMLLNVFSRNRANAQLENCGRRKCRNGIAAYAESVEGEQQQGQQTAPDQAAAEVDRNAQQQIGPLLLFQ